MRNQKRRTCGQSLVEFTLIAGVFLAILLGIINWSWMMFEHESLTSQASRAARYAAVHDMSDNTKVLAAKSIALTPSFDPNTSVSVTVQPLSYTANNGATVNVNQVVVTISNYRVSPWFFVPTFFGRPITATAIYEYCTDPCPGS
jgi:Flp pilus assembly protein TadG